MSYRKSDFLFSVGVLTSDVCSHFSTSCFSDYKPDKHNPDSSSLNTCGNMESFKVPSEMLLYFQAQKQKVTLAQFNAASLFSPSIVDSCVLQLPGDRRSDSHWPFLAAY